LASLLKKKARKYRRPKTRASCRFFRTRGLWFARMDLREKQKEKKERDDRNFKQTGKKNRRNIK